MTPRRAMSSAWADAAACRAGDAANGGTARIALQAAATLVGARFVDEREHAGAHGRCLAGSRRLERRGEHEPGHAVALRDANVAVDASVTSLQPRSASERSREPGFPHASSTATCAAR